jgi:hypothetical protein
MKTMILLISSERRLATLRIGLYACLGSERSRAVHPGGLSMCAQDRFSCASAQWEAEQQQHNTTERSQAGSDLAISERKHTLHWRQPESEPSYNYRALVVCAAETRICLKPLLDART